MEKLDYKGVSTLSYMVDSGGRIRVIDVLRGFAIVLMLFQHTPLFFLNDLDSKLYIHALIASRLSAPLFVLIVGYCIFLSGGRRIERSGRVGFLQHLVFRTFQLMALGCAISIFRFESIFSLNVIHLIAFAVLFTGLLYLSTSRLAYAVTLTALSTYSLIGPEYNSGILVKTPIDSLAWLMTSGEYPTGSWMVYAIVGLGVAWFLRGVRVRWERIFYLGWILIIASMALVLVGVKFDMVGNSAPFMFFILGAMVFVYVFGAYAARQEEWSFLSNPLAAFGRHSLPIYVVHQFLFITVPRIGMFNNTLNEPEVVLLFLAFLAAAYAVIAAYERRMC
ncbi:MAG: heparan-alpha-glucosaminide N-acetyltransferase domain-containing protein [Candidatus Altiarchaeota archaeon]